ncbi:MAG: transcription activator effector binding, partial [Hyphomicrobiales bacterium]|nr:transcription activator effector binding [Hyphomicrobiales bacterium]
PSPAEPAAPAPSTPAPAPEAAAPSETPTVKVVEIPGRPSLVFEGSSTWEDGYTSLSNAFQRLRAELERVGVKTAARPVAVFTSTDDAGFRFQAMLPLSEQPSAPPQLGAEFKMGQTPPGRAVKFEHRGSYDEIDSTYEAITAWLDDKNLEARDFFAEEYLTDSRGPDDTSLQVDVYVYVK